MTQIEATQHSPKVMFDKESGILEIIGNSYMVNPLDFYSELINYFENVSDNQKKKLSILIKIGYCSSSSLQILHGLFCIIGKKHAPETSIVFMVDSEDKDDGIQFVNEVCFNSNLTPSINYY